MLSFLTEPGFPKAAVGIDAAGVSVVSIQSEGRGRYGLRQAAAVDLPKGLVTPGFTEKNIANQSQFRVILEEAASSAGLLGQREWSVSLPSNTARTAILNIENGGKGETEEVLDWKAEQAFGTPASQLRISLKKLDSNESGKSRFMATAVKLSVLDEYETVFESLNWKAGLILPRVLSESSWLTNTVTATDSMLISGQDDGFTAMLFRGGDPLVVRNVTCTPAERDDEIYRLLMFYNDRFASPDSAASLGAVLAIGNDLAPEKLRKISTEAFGTAVTVLGPDEVGFQLPYSNPIGFDTIAAPAALASLGLR